MRRWSFCLRLFLGLGLLAASGPAQAQVPPPPTGGESLPSSMSPAQLKNVRIDQKLGAKIDPNLTFEDSNGRTVRIGDYLKQGKPLVLAMVYYKCPGLCTLVLNGLLRTLNAVTLDLGKDFHVLNVSIDPRENRDIATDKRAGYLGKYKGSFGSAGWHFLTGKEPQIKALADTVGFRYEKNEQTGEYVHASGIMIVTPEGTVSRYMLGVEYSARDLRLGLVEASKGQIGSLVDEVFIYCFRYDPNAAKYSLAIMKVLRAGAVLTLVLLVGYIATMLWRERRRRYSQESHAR